VNVEIAGAIGKKTAFAGMNDDVESIPFAVLQKKEGAEKKQAEFFAAPSQSACCILPDYQE